MIRGGAPTALSAARPAALTALLLVSAALGLLGCASLPGEEGDTAAAWQGPDCVQLSRVREYQLLDSRNLLVYAPDRANAFHIVLAGACPGLRLGAGLRMQGDRGRLCGFPGERLSTALPGLDSRRDRDEGCRISSVQALDPAGLQELLIRFGRGEDGEPAAGEPEQQMP
ncbi:MAG: hypothetical protein JJT93_05385 [Gammaproteobacteria bacterium]|nr:hypothetical protein [Gammaproteobacteria bacterium]